jgi:hypothetical protein
MLVAVGCATHGLNIKNQQHPGGVQHQRRGCAMSHPSRVRCFLTPIPRVARIRATRGYQHRTPPGCQNAPKQQRLSKLSTEIIANLRCESLCSLWLILLLTSDLNAAFVFTSSMSNLQVFEQIFLCFKSLHIYSRVCFRDYPACFGIWTRTQRWTERQSLVDSHLI